MVPIGQRRALAAIATLAITIGFIGLATREAPHLEPPLEQTFSIASVETWTATPAPTRAPTPPPTKAPAPAGSGDFWTELDRCESPNGDTHPLYVGEFQFHPDTAARAGGSDLAAAKRWAARLHAEGTSPGSSAGWPVCWWVAKRRAGYAPY